MAQNTLMKSSDNPFFIMLIGKHFGLYNCLSLRIPYFKHSDRPAAIRIDVRGLTDTSNFDEFPPIDSTNESSIDQIPSDKDWVFINYTYKRFEGLTQRGKKRS